MKRKRNTYKRKYNEDMTSYTYPKDEENKYRSKQDLVFQNMEITGTKTFVNWKHKYSMLVYHKDRLFPILLKIN